MIKSPRKPRSKEAIRSVVYNKYCGKCAYCGCDIDKYSFEPDHIQPRKPYNGVPLPRAELHSINNLNPACKICNKWKSNYTLEEFRNELSMQLERVRVSSNYKMALKYGLINETPHPIIFYFETTSPLWHTRIGGSEWLRAG